ncbi:MAG: hypothetical protein H5T92_01265, partial [Synergistales bacterium]|nr:hypothetical protein [Synergistales bacterium]
NASFRFSREAIYSSRPDIVITTPDYINHRLTLSGPEDPNSLLLLGKPGYYCKDCGKTYTEVVRSCRDGCGGTPIQTQSGKPPIAIVIDEAHLFRGEFGAQVAHLFLRLEHAIRRLYGLKGWRPLYILSSATLSSPTDRASELTTCDRKNIEVIEPQYHEEETTYRNHIVILPKTYTALASVERALEVPYGMTCALRSVSGGLEDPRTLVFVNSISNANDLINTLQRMLSRGGVRVGGHTTDYHDERAAVEDAFLRGELDILVATRGLEVGVDFDRVNIGVIFGMPFYLSEYVQRIGRIGRKGDSIIINVLTPDRNINYYYYMNCHLLTDSSFREQHMRQEASVIKVDNPVALKRFAQRAIFDWFSVEYPFNRAALDVTAKDRIIEYILACIAPLRLSHEEEERVRDEAQQYIERNLGHLFSWETKAETIIKELRRHTHGGGRLGYLHNLRTFDRQVEIRPDLRTRNLSIMFRRSMRGMIYSFRGRYYVIDTVEHRPAFQLGTSGVEINEWE